MEEYAREEADFSAITEPHLLLIYRTRQQKWKEQLVPVLLHVI